MSNPSPSNCRSVFRSCGPWLALLALLCLSAGCAGYFVGAQTLYRPDLYTIHVPVFESESFRRFLGEQLTEAVVKQIELKTPYKIAPEPTADTILQGRLLTESKYAITENINDELRDIEFLMSLEVTWRDRQGRVLFGPEAFALPLGLVDFGQSVHFVPEGGQSLSTAQLDAIDRLAEQIVSRLEIPW